MKKINGYEKEVKKMAPSYNTYLTDNGTSSSLSTTWANWATTPSTDSTTNGTWYRWTEYDGITLYPGKIVLQPTLTPEQLRQLEEQRQKEEIERQHREENKRIAEERALQLLLENLDENQKAVYETTKAIPIKVKSGHLYRINKGRAGNVEQVNDKGIRLKKLCFHPTENVPDFDTMLAQKLMLECCEEDVLRIANIS